MRFYLNFFMLVAIEFKGRFELFRKFIRFGTLTRPLYEYREKSKNVPYTFPLLTGVPTDLSDYIALIMIYHDINPTPNCPNQPPSPHNAASDYEEEGEDDNSDAGDAGDSLQRCGAEGGGLVVCKRVDGDGDKVDGDGGHLGCGVEGLRGRRLSGPRPGWATPIKYPPPPPLPPLVRWAPTHQEEKAFRLKKIFCKLLYSH